MREQAKRQTELDVLRLLATLAVIMIHAGLDPHTDNASVHLAFCGIHAAIVWWVPVFFMISGRFFLDPGRNVTQKSILRKTLPHIVVVFLFWSAIFTVYYVLSGAYDGLNVFGILTQFIDGPYHLWYLYALAGLYLLTPLLRKIAADEKTLVYMLLLFAAVNLTYEYLIYLPKVGGVLESFISGLGLQTVTGYLGYYLLGYLIWSKRDAICGRRELMIYAIGIIMLAVTIAGECLVSAELRSADFVKQYMKPNVILYSAALYTFFIKRVARIRFSEKTQQVFARLTEYGFGVYCIHALLNELISTPQLPGLSLLSSLLRVLVLYLLSLFLTFLIRKIPVIGKKIT